MESQVIQSVMVGLEFARTFVLYWLPAGILFLLVLGGFAAMWGRRRSRRTLDRLIEEAPPRETESAHFDDFFIDTSAFDDLVKRGPCVKAQVHCSNVQCTSPLFHVLSNAEIDQLIQRAEKRLADIEAWRRDDAGETASDFEADLDQEYTQEEIAFLRTKRS